MLNVFIGCNGAGKSNFISLFKMLQHIIDNKLEYYVTSQGGVDSILHFGSKTTEQLFVDFKFGDNGYGFILVPTKDNKLMFEEEWFYWEISGKKYLGSGYLESRWKKGTDTGIDNYVMPILKEQKWRVYHFHDTSDTALIKREHGINDNISFATDARNLAAFLYMLKETESQHYEKIVKTIRLVAPFFDDFILRPNPLKGDRIQLEWKGIDNDIPFTASQLSDGTLRFICLATLLLQPPRLMSETILIDEPELGLHPYAITILASLIKSASKKKQIIISTQSVELLNQFDVEDIVVVNREENNSTFNRLNEKELEIWLENEYTLGELWNKNLLGGRPAK
nr:AAA family ATPase [Tissierella pigra]